MDAAARGTAATGEGPFVINLCSSTTPVALSQPHDAELKRFSFFVSRRLEDGRERFRLHMGFFETLQDAEDLLSVVREVYPGAWAGEAPGKRLRPPPEPLARALGASAAAPAMAKPASPSRAPQPSAATPSTAIPGAAAPRVAAARPQTATRSAEAAPIVRAAPSKTRAAVRPEPPTVFPAGTSRTSAAAARSAPARAAASTSTATPQRPASPNAAVPSNAAKALNATPGARLPLSNVREVLRALDETGATQQMPAFESGIARGAGRGLSDSQVLKLLETRRPQAGQAPEDSSIAVLKPDDTGTRRELKDAVATNAPVSFAVQLQWSVQQIEIAKVPPLAIFSAYTLYTVEGSREGRRWYGLRLGFFTDAVAAKQVAQYVRSEFASVAVVPVGAQERARASTTDKGANAKAPTPPAPVLDKLPQHTSEFKLIDETPALPASTAASEQEPAKEPAKAPAKRSGKAPGGRVRAREKRSPQTLEETLEILGADELEIDKGQGNLLTDTGVRHLRMEVRKESPFTKLLDRLSERARKGR